MIALLALSSLLFSCGLGESDPSPADPTGRRYVSTEVGGRPIPGGGPLVLSFPARERLAAKGRPPQADHRQGEVGTGTVDLSGGTIRAGALASTPMSCPPRLDGADDWMRTLFAGRPRWTLDGDVLTLTTGAATVTLTERADRR